MWPKAFLQLLELAPHITRLVPAADRYLQSKVGMPDSQRRALEEMAAGLRTELGKIEGGLRGDLTQVAAAQAGIYQQVNQQSETLVGMAADVRTMRLASDEMEARLARIEMQTARIWVALLVGLGWIFVAVVVVIVAIRIRWFVRGS
jgi:hypothetical protein